VRHGNLAELVQAASVPVLTVKRGISDEGLLDSVAELRPDALDVAGWFHMVPRSWRELAPAYGLHASLHPKFRGGAPLVWAMINGEETTGITLFLLDEGVDTSPIVGQRVVPIRPDDSIATLYSRVEKAGVELIRADLPRIAAGTASPTPQLLTLPVLSRSLQDCACWTLDDGPRAGGC
jgi:methionyl-tRNA formyltransferase